MSSFIVSPEDIQYLLTSAVTLGVMAGNNTPPAYRWHSEDGGGAFKLTPQNASFLGTKLWMWNVMSVLDDYPHSESAPGYAKPWIFEYDPAADYVFDPLQIIKSIAHFQYQCHKNDPWGMGFLHALQQDALSIAIAQRADLVWGSPSRAVSEESIAQVRAEMAVPAAESATEPKSVREIARDWGKRDGEQGNELEGHEVISFMAEELERELTEDEGRVALNTYAYGLAQAKRQLEAEEERNAEDGLRTAIGSMPVEDETVDETAQTIWAENERPGDPVFVSCLYRCNECETEMTVSIEGGRVPETPVEPPSSTQCLNCRVGLALFEKRLTPEELADWQEDPDEDEEPDDEEDDPC